MPELILEPAHIPTPAQHVALANPRLLAVEALYPMFGQVRRSGLRKWTEICTVNSGWE